MLNEELYKSLYAKYAPDLSQEELNQKLEYASTLSVNDFVNSFYKKYTGQGPSQEQVDYMNSILEQPEKQEPKEANWWDSTWIGRGWKAGGATGEASDLLYDSDIIAGNFENVDTKTINNFIEAYKDQASSYVPSERMETFIKKYNERGPGWASFFKGFKEDPTIAAELMVQSMATQASTFFEEEGGGRKAAGVGLVTGAGLGSCFSGCSRILFI